MTDCMMSGCERATDVIKQYIVQTKTHYDTERRDILNIKLCEHHRDFKFLMKESYNEIECAPPKLKRGFASLPYSVS